MHVILGNFHYFLFLFYNQKSLQFFRDFKKYFWVVNICGRELKTVLLSAASPIRTNPAHQNRIIFRRMSGSCRRRSSPWRRSWAGDTSLTSTGVAGKIWLKSPWRFSRVVFYLAQAYKADWILWFLFKESCDTDATGTFCFHYWPSILLCVRHKCSDFIVDLTRFIWKLKFKFNEV